MQAPYIRLSIIAILAALIASAWQASPAVLGCAPAPPPGQWVGISEEWAFIIWDSKTGTEHFIRQANFQTDAPEFGFLVPTPSQPELGEADQSLFGLLKLATAPPIEYVDKHVPGVPPASAQPPGWVGAAPMAAPVTVLDEVQVAGYDAVVLQADDPDSLAKWLEEHGYAFRPALRDWLQAYTDEKWIITAFKISANRPGNAETKSVRMSFKTERPFYPYREPEDMRDPEKAQGKSRTLRVFVLSHERVRGELGIDPQDKSNWPGRAVYAERLYRLDEQNLTSLAFGGGPQSFPLPELDDPIAPPRAVVQTLNIEHAWLTEFEDQSSPRPGTDELYFVSDDSQQVLHKPAVRIERIVYDGIALPPAPDGNEHASPVFSVGSAHPVRWVTIAGGAFLLLSIVVVAVIVACVWPLGRTHEKS